MIRLTTTTCGACGLAELTLVVEADELVPQAQRWVQRLEARAQAGERWQPDTLVHLDGWPAVVVKTDEGVELHEQDLSLGADQRPLYRPGVSQIARWATEQWNMADAHGLEFAPLSDELVSVQVCQRFKTTTGRFLLVRSAPHSSDVSGWVLQCLGGCRTHSSVGSTHTDAWLNVSVFEFMKHRPGLVRYLALPVGTMVRGERAEVEVGRRRATATPLTANAAMLDLPSSSLVSEFEPLRAQRALGRAAELVMLGFGRDADVWQSLLATDAQAIISERYRVDQPTAARTVAHHFSRGVLRSRVRWLFRDQLTAQQFDLVLPMLTEGTSANPCHAAAMKLREVTGTAFAPLMQLVELVRAHLDEADRGRVRNA